MQMSNNNNLNNIECVILINKLITHLLKLTIKKEEIIFFLNFKRIN